MIPRRGSHRCLPAPIPAARRRHPARVGRGVRPLTGGRRWTLYSADPSLSTRGSPPVEHTRADLRRLRGEVPLRGTRGGRSAETRPDTPAGLGDASGKQTCRTPISARSCCLITIRGGSERTGRFCPTHGCRHRPRPAPIVELVDRTALPTATARRGEAAGLRWADVDLNGRVIVIGQQRIAYGHTIAVGPPKTASSRRVIALDRVTARLLRTHLRRQRAERHAAGGTRQDSGYVFTTPDGAPLHPDWPTRRFHRLVELSGLPPVRLHDLRHGAATLAHATGADLKTVQELLGHASIVLTTDTYTSVLLDLHFTTAEAAARLVLAAAARNPAKRHHRRPPASPPKSAAPPPTTGPQPKRPKRSRHGRGCQQGAPTHVPRAPHKDQGRIARKLYGLRSTGAPPGTRTPNPRTKSRPTRPRRWRQPLRPGEGAGVQSWRHRRTGPGPGPGPVARTRSGGGRGHGPD